MSITRKVNKKVKIVQIAIGHFKKGNGYQDYSVIGLGSNSQVYRWSRPKGKWIPFQHVQVEDRSLF